MSTVPPNPQAAAESSAANPARTQREPAFGPPSHGPRETPWAAWGIAGAVVVVLILVVLLLTHHKAESPGNAVLPPAAYAVNLPISGIEMSESTSLSGGKSTFIDGHIRNTGAAPVNAATVQVLFANDEAMPPQIETVPLTLIRTRQPYVDIEPVSAAPIAPGEDREFRLIFEDVSANWNQQLPEIHVVKAATR